MVYTNRIRSNADRRPQAFWGALIGAGASLIGGLVSGSQQSRAQKRALEEQQRLAQQQLEVSNQNQLASTLNNYALAQQSYDDKDYNLKYRIGGVKRLGGRNIMITDGGNAKRIGNNTYILRGGSHEDINETGQTGIGINVGGNEIEAEGGEVAQRKGNSLRIYSAQPILGGISPAEAIMRGYNKDKVFNAQQRFKKNNDINDDGSKARNGGYYDWARNTSSNLGISFIDPTYDYRAYYNSVTPYERNLIRFAPQGTHFTDIGKTIKHPTFSNESKYSNKKTPGGTWNGNVFVPAIWQFGDNGNAKRNKYMKGSGEGYFNGRKNVYPKRYGGLTSKDRGSSKHPYPSVSSKDFAGGNRSYPIPTKADAIDALRLAGLHGRNDVRSKVYSKYPELRKKAGFGDWIKGFIFGNNNNSNVKKKPIYRSARGKTFTTAREAYIDNDKYYHIDPIYRYQQKGKLYHQKYGLRELNIPFQKQNAITIRNGGRASGAVVSPNQLDSIAKYATRAGLSIPTALGLAIKESTLNNATDTKSAAKLKGFKVGTRDYENWITGQHIQGTNSHRGTSSAREWINFHKDDDLNPYWETIDYLNKYSNISTRNEYNKRLLASEKYDDNRAKKAPRLTGGTKMNVLEYGFRDYKNNPKKYNPKQPNYVQLVNQNARDIMNSPQIKQWYKTSRYTKGKKFNLGGLTNPPVEMFKCGGHIRPKAVDGMLAPIYSYGTDKRRLPSFAPIDVTPRAIPNFKNVRSNYYIKPALSQFDTNISFASKPNTTPSPIRLYEEIPVNKVTGNTTPFLGRQSSFKPATQDYIGLGIDTLAALGSGMFTRSAYNKMNFDYALPNYVDESPVAFDTTYHNEAQRANIERNRLNSRNLISGNTSSAQTALGRMQQTDTDAMMETNKLLDEKSNKEVELRNQNLANEQQVRARNAAARNQYYQSVAQIKNAALEAKNNIELARAQSIGADLSGLSQAWTNFATGVANRYNTNQNRIAAIASADNPSVVKNAISMGYNLSPEILANIYKTTTNEDYKKLILGRLSDSERRKYGII